MKSTITLLALAAATVLGLAGCANPAATPAGNPYGYQPNTAPPSANVAPQPFTGSNKPMETDVAEQKKPDAAPTAPSAPTPAPTPQVKNYPYGVSVSGKPGFVTSPYASPDSGYVDVRGFPPGTEVKDPYTGGVFLVP